VTPEEAYHQCLKKNIGIIELEEIIIQSPVYTFYYIQNVIKEPWEEGEKIIYKHPYFSVSYAKKILEGPFEKCHPYIFDSEYKDSYYHYLELIDYDLNKIKEWLI